MIFVILNRLGGIVTDDSNIVEMLGLGFIEGAAFDGEFMAFGEHTHDWLVKCGAV